MADDAYVREIQQLRADLRDDFAEIRAALERKADKELTAERLSTATQRIAALEKRESERDAQKRSDRRWVVAAIIIPVTIAVVQLLASLRGAA